MEFRNYREEDYSALCDFLTALNQTDRSHINWNWARFEWMAEHPEFDKSLIRSIGLWTDKDKVVGAAVYDMYFGEAFCAALPGYEELYPEILDYAYRELKDENGLGIAVCDSSLKEIEAVKKAGFTAADQRETVMSIALLQDFSPKLPDGLHFAELDMEAEVNEFQWLLWQGFDHGTDRAEFERQESAAVNRRRHFDPRLSIAAVNRDGEKVAYCCLWYLQSTDYAYVEPVCTVPSYRGKGIAKAVVSEALCRAKALGAKTAYVISDMEFYEKLGFEKEFQYTYYWKKEDQR